jgi:hypothetical protein
LGENIEDMGSCGTTGVEIVIKSADAFEKLMNGNPKTYFSAFQEIIDIMGKIPKEIKNCYSVKNSL